MTNLNDNLPFPVDTGVKVLYLSCTLNCHVANIKAWSVTLC